VARQSFDVPCRIRVVNTFESLEAHVELPDGVTVEPGDEVLVQGERVDVPFGSTLEIERMATITRASSFERAWTRVTGNLEFMELCEFSFSSGSRL
jgi:uncharacterized Zn finger protein